MGRVNYGEYLHDRKGLQGEVHWIAEGKDSVLKGWKHYAFPLGEESPKGSWHATGDPKNTVKDFANNPIRDMEGPALYKGFFNTDSKADFFLEMREFNKGVTWINGHCLGRYWNIGPTQTMFVPGVWLKKGKNEIVIMDLYTPRSLQLQGLDKPILDSPK
jgi:beta-galactosidase